MCTSLSDCASMMVTVNSVGPIKAILRLSELTAKISGPRFTSRATTLPEKPRHYHTRCTLQAFECYVTLSVSWKEHWWCLLTQNTDHMMVPLRCSVQGQITKRSSAEQPLAIRRINHTFYSPTVLPVITQTCIQQLVSCVYAITLKCSNKSERKKTSCYGVCCGYGVQTHLCWIIKLDVCISNTRTVPELEPQAKRGRMGWKATEQGLSSSSSETKSKSYKKCTRHQ